jgi:hypothetical protein
VNLKLWDVSNPNDYTFNTPLMTYLDNGGIVWLQGLDFLYDIYGGAPDDFAEGQFVYDYMGISRYHAQSYADDGGMGVPQLDVVEGNGLCTFTPMTWVYTAMWYVDALALAPEAQPIYSLGPDGYMFDDYFAGVYNQYSNAKIFTLATETARIDTEAHTDALFSQVLTYFESITPVVDLQPAINKHQLVSLYPNPVKDVLHFSMDLKSASSVQLRIIDITGNIVEERFFGTLPEGTHELVHRFTGPDYSDGIYFYSLETDKQIINGKIILSK